MLIKPIFSIRSRSHIETRLQTRDEAAFARRLLPVIAPLYTAFAFIDWISTKEFFLSFLAIRAIAVLISRFGFLLTRGRARYATRTFIATAPYAYAIEFIMCKYGLVFTPYFAGVGIVILCGVTLFPTRLKVAAILSSLYIAPLLIWGTVHYRDNPLLTLLMALMAIGTALLATVSSGQIHKDLRAGLSAAEALARDLGKREKEIRRKAEELFKRKIFESQFAPQVVAAILKDRSLTKDMMKSHIVNIVIDIQNSTSKANTLEPLHYKEVVEEVLDVFSASCLKWNITLDKFIGDGVQAFAGAPMQQKDDLQRAVMACRETMTMLEARKAHLESLWKDELNVRFAISEGPALVGFIGRGAFKSYTAVGDMVSFTHRLSSVPVPWTIALYSWTNPSLEGVSFMSFSTETKMVSDLKGFGSRKFRVTFLTPGQENATLDAGRCKTCETPLVLEEGPMGVPKIYCPACHSQNAQQLKSAA